LLFCHSNFRGVAPNDLTKYNNKQQFTCFDGSKTLQIESINDDYCDCLDGSDEPGTSACSHTGNTKFHCQNQGFYSKLLHPSFVNDGICDCCDGTDEYENQLVKCGNTCKEEGVGIRKLLLEKINTLAEGLNLKQQYITEGVTKFELKSLQLQEQSDKFNVLQVEMNELEAKKNNLEKIEEAERNLLREEAKRKESQEHSEHPEIGVEKIEEKKEEEKKEEEKKEEGTPESPETHEPPKDITPEPPKEDFTSYKNEEIFIMQENQNLKL